MNESATSGLCSPFTAADPNGVMAVRVARRHVEAEGIVSFEFVDIDNGELPGFQPGAHIDVHMPGGLTRQYSLCNPANETRRYKVAVLRDAGSRGGSVAMHDTVMEGDVLEISAPRNFFRLDEGAGHSLLFAGGIGVTPMLCMADQLHRQGRRFTMHYCVRSKERMAFHNAISQSAWAGNVKFHFDDCASEQALDIESVLDASSTDTHLYVCGPQGYMDAVLDKARKMGWSKDRLHFEYFKHDVTSKDGDIAFEVEVASTGKVFVIPADRSIAAVLGEQGVNIPVSCEQGVCGTCLTKVLAGVPDHRDSFLLADEREANNQMTPCCSRSRSTRLILDL